MYNFILILKYVLELFALFSMIYNLYVFLKPSTLDNRLVPKLLFAESIFATAVAIISFDLPLLIFCFLEEISILFGMVMAHFNYCKWEIIVVHGKGCDCHPGCLDKDALCFKTKKRLFKSRCPYCHKVIEFVNKV